MRLVVALLLASAPALAQPVPGTSDDPIAFLTLRPWVVDTPGVLAMRGGATADTVVLFDGFEVPYVFVGERSIFPRESVYIDEVSADGGADFGRAPTTVWITTKRGKRFVDRLQVDSRAASLSMEHTSRPWPIMAAAQYTWDQRHLDAIERLEKQLSRHWWLTFSAIGSYVSEGNDVQRLVLTASHVRGPWRASIAASGMSVESVQDGGELQYLDIYEQTVDTRAELSREIGWVAGLSHFGFRVGEQTNFSRYGLNANWPLLPHEGVPEPQTQDAFDTSTRAHRIDWLLDSAIWGEVHGNLSPQIKAMTGLRLEAFDGYLTTQPRGQIEWKLTKRVTGRLSAGAYRRPPEQLGEIIQRNLHPERTTQLLAEALYRGDGFGIVGSAYYIDRSRLIASNPDGLANTGFGTSIGADVVAIAGWRRWAAHVGVGLAKSTRIDHQGDRERPAQYDQRLRFDATLVWHDGPWLIGGRARYASGLPYTPVQTAVYNSDHDYYAPIFDQTYSARLPSLYHLDLRADRKLGRHFTAFLDVQLAYGTLDYIYSYDYRERFAKKPDPIFPFAGLRGEL